MLKFTEGFKTLGITFKKLAFSEGNQLYAGDFRANLDKRKRLNLQRHGTGNGVSNIRDSFAESLQLQMSILHQSMCILKAGFAGLSSEVIARQNMKKKYLMCHIPIKMLKQHANPNSSLRSLKIYSSKKCRNTR